MESHPLPQSSPKSSVSDELKAIANAMRESDALSAVLRARFVEIRSELFVRGIFDPVLARFDSITVAKAPLHEIADQLDAIAASL
jgi:hypothetical protein